MRTKLVVVLYFLDHLLARREARRLRKCCPSHCITPSVVTMNGVESARRCLHACACFVFFSCARLSKRAATGRLEYDWASALQTRKQRLSLWMPNTPHREIKINTRPHWSPPALGAQTCTTESRTVFVHHGAHRLGHASLSGSLPELVYSRSTPQPSRSDRYA